MTLQRQALGRRGEAQAAAHLARQGLRVWQRNVRLPGGELDLVAWDGETLVFVEVRARRRASCGGPLASVGGRKQWRVRRLAEVFLWRTGLVGRVACRFDVVGIVAAGAGLAPVVEHVRDAF